jgi:hypothetical protein
MADPILYEELCATKNYLHSGNANFRDALKLLIDNDTDDTVVTYNSGRRFMLFNIAVLELDNDNNIFYEFDVLREADVIDNISFDCNNVRFKINYFIGGQLYDLNEVGELVFVALRYNACVVRITFLEKPNNDTLFEMKYKCHLWNKSSRVLLESTPIVVKNGIYANGMFGKNNI